MRKHKIGSVKINAISLGTVITALFFNSSFSIYTPVSAQSTAWTSGCGSGWSKVALMVFSPIASNQFRVACNEHDACYDTFGKSKSECDIAFHNRMLGICSSDHNTWFGKGLKALCNGRADAYYNAVRMSAQDAYNTAQKRASNPNGEKTLSPRIVLPPKTVKYGTTACSFSGRTGQLSISNGSSSLAYIALYHPDSGAKYWEQELSAGGTVVTPFAIGNDWGLNLKYVEDSRTRSWPINCVGDVTYLSGGFWKGTNTMLTRIGIPTVTLRTLQTIDSQIINTPVPKPNPPTPSPQPMPKPNEKELAQKQCFNMFFTNHKALAQCIQLVNTRY